MTVSRRNPATAHLPPAMDENKSFIRDHITRLVEKFEEDELGGENDLLNPEINLDDAQPANIPNELPILPLRGLVVYPQTAVPLTIGQPRSIRLVDDAMAGDKLIGLVTSKNPELENPGPDDLYPIGTVAVIHRMFRAPDGTIRLLVQGLIALQARRIYRHRTVPEGRHPALPRKSSRKGWRSKRWPATRATSSPISPK